MPKNLLKIQNVIFKFMPDKAFSEMGFGKKDFMQLSNSMMDLNFEHSIKKINCDVLILCGEKDKANNVCRNDACTGGHIFYHNRRENSGKETYHRNYARNKNNALEGSADTHCRKRRENNKT